MMRRVLATALAGCVLVAGAAQAQDEEALCGAYAAVGGVMAEELLDVTMRDFIKMNQGKNPLLLHSVTMAIASAWDGRQMMAVTAMDGDGVELLGEAAGQTAMTLMLEGTTADADELRAIMMGHCRSVGMDNIIANQRAVRAAVASNMGG